jgi:uncharacterized protein (DUF1330 family)
MDPTADSLLIIATLTLRDGEAARFQDFESQAARIMHRYGGVIERTITLLRQSSAEPERELHILRFPNREAFDACRADADLADLSALRAAAIAHTEILFGRDGPNYNLLPPP